MYDVPKKDSEVSMSDMDLKHLPNRIIDDICVPSDDLPLQWKLYWLKSHSYEQQLHILPMNLKQHSHSFFEIHIVTEGKLEYEIEEKQVVVESGSIILFSPHVMHQLRAFSKTVKKYAVAFEVDANGDREIGLMLHTLEKIRYACVALVPEITIPLEYILGYTDQRDTYAPYVLRSLLNVFLMALLKRVCSIDDGRKPAEPHPESEPSLFKSKFELNDQMVYESVVKYLTENVSRQVIIEEVAQIFLMSTKQLNRRLERFKGISFSKLQEQIKCARARELLPTNMSISDISEAVGFSNEYSFNRFFKRVEGMTPGRFREAMRSSNFR